MHSVSKGYTCMTLIMSSLVQWGHFVSWPEQGLLQHRKTHRPVFQSHTRKPTLSLVVCIPRHPTLDNKADTGAISHLGHLLSYSRQYRCATSWLPLVPWVSKREWGPGGCRSGYMLVPGLDLARIEISFSCESILLDSGDYLSTGANALVADLEDQGEPYILQMRKAGFKMLSSCVNPQTRNQATDWLSLTF